jgi:hypothetical protein
MKIKTIFTVTVIEGLDLRSEKRCMGYYNKFKDANNVVINNMTDINETMYDYAVIEEFVEGLYPDTKSIHYYKFNESSEKYEEIERPKEWNQICNWGIG